MAEQTSQKSRLSSPPHLRTGFNTNKIMLVTLVSLLIPAIGGMTRYGTKAVGIIATTVITAVIAGALCQKLRGKPLKFEISTVISGLLLALVLPPGLPLWMAAIGSIFAICIVKEAFGGTGQNIFNPVLGAQAFLLASFATPMSQFIKPTGFGGKIVAMANPLAVELGVNVNKGELYQNLLFGNSAGFVGGSALLVIIGGILLLLIGTIDFRTPLVFLATVAITSLAFGADPVFHLLAGGVMFAAFYFACDPVTTPLYWKGRLVFAVGAGVLTVLIRQLGSPIDGIPYAILIMNGVTPLIDRYIKPIPMGMKKVKRNES